MLNNLYCDKQKYTKKKVNFYAPQLVTIFLAIYILTLNSLDTILYLLR